MDTSINCFRITDYVLAASFVRACWDETMEDNASDDYVPDIVNELWVGMRADNDIVGCYRLHQLNTSTWQGHAFMLL